MPKLILGYSDKALLRSRATEEKRKVRAEARAMLAELKLEAKKKAIKEKNLIKIDTTLRKQELKIQAAQVRADAELSRLRKKANEKSYLAQAKKDFSTWSKQKSTKRGFAKGFASSLKFIGKSAPKQKISAVDVQAVLRQRQMAQQMPVQKYSRYRNFFEHGDPEEVYGDDGLTFFDGGKRKGGDTGALFGI